MALGALQVCRTVALVRLRMVLATVLHAGSTKVGLVVGTGVLTRSIVGSEAVRAEITFAEKALQGCDGVVMLVFMKYAQWDVAVTVLEAGVGPVGVKDDDL